MSTIWRQARTFLYRRILHADDSPHRIALGVAVATFVAFLPIMGIQTIVALAAAAVLRANKAVCIPIVWITNPFTAVPIYGSCWWLGHALLTGRAESDPGTFASRLATTMEHSGLAAWHNLFAVSFWKKLLAMMVDFGQELWVGTILVGFVATVVLYFASRWSVTAYRQRRAGQRTHRKVIRPPIAPPSAPTPSRRSA